MIGYGNSMFLATHGILARSASGGAVDPDAQAFITAASITNPTQQSAINQLVVDLKGYSIWTKMKAVYPFVGGTASQHKFNLKDPRDLDAAFRLVFNGGWTHSSTGATPNGTNGYADTKLNGLSVLGQNSTHVAFYSRTNSLKDGITIGNTWGNIGGETSLWARSFTNITAIRINGQTAATQASTDSTGLWIGNRISSTQMDLFVRNSKTSFPANSQTIFNGNYWLAAAKDTSYCDNKQYAFASIGDGLTDTEAANFYTAVQAFNTTLGRQV
jgi:hypothetical protein